MNKNRFRCTLKVVTFITTALVVISCKKNTGLTTEVIDIDSATLVDSVRFSTYLNSPKIIKLETNKDCILQEIYRLDVFDEKLYILDAKSNRLLVFDSNGHYLYDIGKRGNGNREYLQISDFSIDRQNKVVYIWDEGRGNAMAFDANTGKFLSKITHGVKECQCYDILFSNGKLYVNQTSSPNITNDSMIKEIDVNSGEKTGEHLNADLYNKGWNLPLRSKKNGFAMRGTSTPKYIGMFGDVIVSFTENGIHPAYHVKSKKFVSKDDIEYITKQYEKNGVFEWDRLNKSNKISGIFNYLEWGNTIHFSFRQGSEIHTLLYDKTTHSSVIPKFFGDDYLLKGGMCYLELCYSDNSIVIAALQTDAIPIFVNYAVKSDKLNKQINNYEVLENLSDNFESNPILFVYEIK